jgi:hypothetical protein
VPSQKTPLLTILLTLSFSLSTSWAWSVLLAGRVLPWQATREWVLVFSIVFIAAAFRWWCYWSEVASQTNRASRGLTAAAWGAGPSAVATVLFLCASYLLDGFYGFLLLPFFRLQLLAGAAIATVLLESLLVASAIWLRSEGTGVTSALREAATSRSGMVALGGLVAIGLIQATAHSSPIGDDLGQYVEAALALLDRLPYPIHQAPSYYVEIGMTGDNPAMPALPLLLATSLGLFGRTLTSIAIPLSAVAVVFPASMYLACRALTGSMTASYVTAILLTLFPVYQLHVLGGPEPDTLFADLLLLVAFLAVKAVGTAKWRYWIGMGIAAGLVANVRYEGLTFSVATLLIFCVFQRPRRQYLALWISYVGTLAPFSLIYHSATGSIWPSSFGGTVSPRNVEANLPLLRDIVLPWHLQAMGVDAPILAALVTAAGAAVVVGLVALWKTRRPLVFVPLLGAGYIASSFLIHPLILDPYSPVDVFRHWSSGIPYVVLSLAFGLRTGYQTISRKLSIRTELVLALMGLALVAGTLYYECERLARPEWYFGGSASLLWTGGGYLLTDLVHDPLPISPRDDPRSWEQIRTEQGRQLAPIGLRATNASEPYYWASLLVVLFGLGFLAAPLFLRLIPIPSSAGDFQVVDS